MWNFLHRNPPPAALDISASGIRMLQLGWDDDGPRLLASARRAFPAGQILTSRQRIDEIRRVIDAGGFTTRDVIAALPEEMAHVRTLRIPPTDSARIESVVRANADGDFPFDLADADVHCMNAGVVRQGNQEKLEIIAAAARNEDVAGFLDELERAGLRATSLRLAPFAALHCAQRGLLAGGDGVTKETVALVEIGSSATTVMIARHKRVMFLKRIPIGTRHLNDAVAGKLGVSQDEAAQLRRRMAAATNTDEHDRNKVSDAVFAAIRGLLEQLARDVEICFRYFSVTFRGLRPSRIALLGSDAGDPRVHAALAGAVPGKLEAIDPLAGIDITAMRGADRGASSGEWTTCVGLLPSRATTVETRTSPVTVASDLVSREVANV